MECDTYLFRLKPLTIVLKESSAPESGSLNGPTPTPLVPVYRGPALLIGDSHTPL